MMKMKMVGKVSMERTMKKVNKLFDILYYSRKGLILRQLLHQLLLNEKKMGKVMMQKKKEVMIQKKEVTPTKNLMVPLKR